MKILYKITLVLMIPLIGLEGKSGPGQQVNWKEEIDGLKRELIARHIDPFFYADSADFSKALDHVAAAAGDKSILDVAIMIQQVVAKLGDAHTRVNYNYLIDNQLILPFDCYWFEEGLFVTRYWKAFEFLAGKKIVSINDFPIEQVIDSLTTLISGATPSLIKEEVPRMLTWSQLLDYFGFVKLPVIIIGLEGADGTYMQHAIELPSAESEHVSVSKGKLPLGWQEKNLFFTDRYFQSEKIYYIQYNKCWSREAEEDYGSGASALFMPSFQEFEKQTLKNVRKLDFEKLVIDLRFNSGGNAIQGTEFVKKLKKTRVEDKASIYLLLGRRTRAEAITNAMDVIHTFQAVVVGEEPGGKPNQFGEVNRFVLTTSNMIVSYSTKYFQRKQENPNAILPDIPAQETFKAFMEGKDVAFEAVKNHELP